MNWKRAPSTSRRICQLRRQTGSAFNGLKKLSTAEWRPQCSSCANRWRFQPAKCVDHLSQAAPLDAADYLPPRLALSGLSGGIGFGFVIVAHAYEGDAAQRSVGLPVSSSVSSHAVGLAASRRDRADAAKLGKGRFGSEVLRSVTEDDQHFGEVNVEMPNDAIHSGALSRTMRSSSPSWIWISSCTARQR